jgi:hypothetical protein
MICPICTEQGLTSLIRVDPFVPKDSSVIQYTDDGAQQHVHDSSYRNRILHCTNGHKLLTTEYDSCPSCDYNAGRTFLLAENLENNTVAKYKFTKDKSWKRVVTFAAE